MRRGFWKEKPMLRLLRIRGTRLHIWFPPLLTLFGFVFLTAVACGLVARWHYRANPRIIVVERVIEHEAKLGDVQWKGVKALKLCPIGAWGWPASYLD